MTLENRKHYKKMRKKMLSLDTPLCCLRKTSVSII